MRYILQVVDFKSDMNADIDTFFLNKLTVQ